MINIIKIFLVLLCISSVSASECVDEFDNFEADTSMNFVEFHGKEIPLLDGHVVKNPPHIIIFIVSRSCSGVLQTIAVKEKEDCIFCNGSDDDFHEYGIEVLDEAIEENLKFRLLEINNMYVLNIWSDEYALAVKHLNLQYLKYIIGLYF